MKVLDYERDFIFDPTLALYLPLWKKDGSVITSEDRYGQLCTVTGAAWTPKGRLLDGTDDTINIPASPETALAGGHTVLMWVKVIAGGSYKNFWSKRLDSDHSMGVFTEPSYAKLTVWFKLDSNPTAYGYLNTSPHENEWMLLGHTASLAGNSVTGYYNGIRKFEDTTYVLPDLSNTDIYIGSSAGGSGFINALVHSFYIWNREFTAHEMSSFHLLTRRMFNLF